MHARVIGAWDRTRSGVLAALVVGLGFRVWGLGWGLQNATISRRPHPDEWPIYWLFQWFGGAHPLDPCPRAPGQCFFDWGTAFPYVAYLAHAVISPVWSIVPIEIFGPHADPVFVRDVVAARLASAILSTATIAVAYLIGRDAFGRGAGVVAAGIVAVSALPIQLAHFGTPDSLSGFLLALALWRALAVLHLPTRRNLLIAAALVGAATGCEYHMALLAAPVICAYLVGRGRSTSYLAWAVLVATLVFFALNPYILIDFPGFLAATEHTLRIRTVDSAVQYQGRWAAYDPAWLYVVRFALAYGVSVPITVWMVAGVGRSVWRHTREQLVLLAWVLPYFVLVSASPAKFMRYSAPLIVPLAVLAAMLGIEVWNRTRARLRPILGALAGAALLYASIYDAAYGGLFSSPDPRTVATQIALAHVDRGAAIAFEELPDGLVNLPYYVDGNGVRACVAEFDTSHLLGANLLMVDQYGVEEHPRIPTARVIRFLSTLRSNSAYRAIARVSYVPTFLGMQFPIDGSPHDWRYPAHQMTIYRISPTPSGGTSQCYRNIAAAISVLYVRESREVLGSH